MDRDVTVDESTVNEKHLSKGVLAQRARRKREREVKDQSIKTFSDEDIQLKVNKLDRDISGEASTVNEKYLSKVVLGQRARRKKEREEREAKDQSIKASSNEELKFEASTVKEQNISKQVMAQRVRRIRERELKDQNSKTCGGLAQCAGTKKEKSELPVKNQGLSNYAGINMATYHVPFSPNIVSRKGISQVPESPSYSHHHQKAKSPLNVHFMTHRQPTSLVPNQSLASLLHPPRLIKMQQPPILAQSPDTSLTRIPIDRDSYMQTFDTSSLMKHINIMFGVKGQHPMMEAPKYMGVGAANAVSSVKSPVAALPTKAQGNSTRQVEETATQNSNLTVSPRTVPSKTGVFSTLASSTPTTNHAASITVNTPAHTLDGMSTASAVISGPGVRGVLASAAASSPVTISNSEKEEVIRSLSDSVAKKRLRRGTSKVSVGEDVSIQPLHSVPLSSVRAVPCASSHEPASAASDLAKLNTSGDYERNGGGVAEQPLVSHLTNKTLMPHASKSSETTLDGESTASAVISGPGVRGVLDELASAAASSRVTISNSEKEEVIRSSSHSFAKKGLRRGTSKVSVVEDVSIQPLHSVPLGSGRAVPSPSSHGPASAASDLAKRNISVAYDRNGGGVVEYPSLSNRVLLPQASNSSETTLDGMSTASAVISGPGVRGVLDESASAAASSPVTISNSEKEEVFRSSSDSVAKKRFRSGISKVSVGGDVSIQPLCSVPLSSGRAVPSPNSHEPSSAASDLAKRNTSGAYERNGGGVAEQPLVSPLSNRILMPHAPKSSETTLDGVSTASTVISAPGVRGVLDESASAAAASSPVTISNSEMEEVIRSLSYSLAKKGLQRGTSKVSVVEDVSIQPLHSVPIGSERAVPSPSSHEPASAASDLGKRNTSGANERSGVGVIEQPLVSPLRNIILLPQTSTSSETTGSTESNHVGASAALERTVLSPSVIQGVQLRPGGCSFKNPDEPVQQMNDSINRYMPANLDIGMPGSDEEEPKTMAVRALKNDDRIMVPKPTGNPPFVMDGGSLMDDARVSSIKIPLTDCPQIPTCNRSPISHDPKVHLVYVSKESDQDLLLKNDNCQKDKKTDCVKPDQWEQQSPQRQAQSDGTEKSDFPTFAPIAVTSPMISYAVPSIFLAKPLNELPSEASNHQTNAYRAPLPGTSQWTNEQHNCYHSNHEEYHRMLQSLSTIDLSKHVLELERRAVKLLLEEGHELMRMKDLNILGTPISMNYLSSLTK